MSRSTRKPYCYIFGSLAALKPDRKFAARCLRHLENRRIREEFHTGDFENWFLPDKYEASHNDRWGWRVDSDYAHRHVCPSPRALTRLGLGDAWVIECEFEHHQRIRRK